MFSKSVSLIVSAACTLIACGPVLAASSQEERNLTELRNTVVNLLQALVERGVLTREQAQAMVQDAQKKAEAEATAKAEKEKAEEGAIRVPYVPEIVKDEIRKEVVAELGPTVTRQVVEDPHTKESLLGALPDWLQRMRWTGDVRVREEGDQFGHDNATDVYLDFNTINSKGGIGKAGPAALLNTTEDRDRLRMRMRFGFDVGLGSGWSAGMRLATGNGTVYISTNQTVGTYGDRYRIAVDQAFVRWTGESSTGRQIFSTAAGRFTNPWLGTDLIWYNDLTFEGITSNYRLNLSSDNEHRKDLFATLGAFPLQDVTPSSHDKWLAAAQIGADLRTRGDSRMRIGAAYYDYMHIRGQRNDPQSHLLDYTAPPLVQKGNTMFDISNFRDTDTSVNLFALAADYKIVDITAIGELNLFPRYSVSVTAEALQNIGYKTADVSARFGTYIPARNRGYRLDLGFGSSHMGEPGTWRAVVGYRYIEKDAVLDAFNDQDFHLGGTDAKGYTATFDFSFNPRVWARARYLATTAIDLPPLSIDVWQLDINTQF